MGCVSSGDNFYHKMGSKIVVGNVYLVLSVFEGHNIYEASSWNYGMVIYLLT